MSTGIPSSMLRYGIERHFFFSISPFSSTLYRNSSVHDHVLIFPDHRRPNPYVCCCLLQQGDNSEEIAKAQAMMDAVQKAFEEVDARAKDAKVLDWIEGEPNSATLLWVISSLWSEILLLLGSWSRGTRSWGAIQGCVWGAPGCSGWCGGTREGPQR